MSQRQVIVRSRRQRVRPATVIARAQAPAIRHGGRGALLSGTAFAALVACGLFSFNDRALAQNTAQLPTGGTVAAGSGTITQTGNTQLTINQTSQNAVYDWRTFNIGAGNKVEFQTPGATSSSMNRVLGPDPSVIHGQLTSNGRLILINQAGVFFGGGAQVNAESLIVGTANANNISDFMKSGRVIFDQASANPNARIVNDGKITVRDGGLVALVGPSAANNGVINARLGRVTIAGAETFTVDLNGDGLVSFAVGNPVSQTPRDADGKALALASNTGIINADGGQVAITAAAARDVVNGVVNVQGQINARTVQNEGGVIVFGGGETTQVNVGGNIDVSGAGATQKGGTVHVTASKVIVQSTARINANGGAGGGTVLVGGGYQGKGPIANARNTQVDKGAVITASATHKGNGGTVIVWADNTTVFGGTINARGTGVGGDGGFVETSGKENLGVLSGALVDAGSDLGRAGTWLLDPRNVVISNSGTNSVVGGTNNPTDGAGTYTIDRDSVQNVLNTGVGGTNVTITTNANGVAPNDAGNITVSNSITWATGATLTLSADNNIAINGSITGLAGTLELKAGLTTAAGTITQSDPISVNALTFSTTGGAVTLTDNANLISSVSGTAGGAIAVVSATSLTISGLTSGAASNVAVTTNGVTSNLVVNAAISGTGVNLIAGANLSGTGDINGGTGAVSLKASGLAGINLSGVVSGTGLTVQANSGPVSLSNVNNAFNSFTAAAAIGGSVTVMHKDALTINGLDAGTNAVSFTTITAGNITVGGDITAGDLTLSASGALSVNAALTVAGGNVGLVGASISQGAGGVITASVLGVVSAGVVDLSTVASSITTLVGNVGSIAFKESNGFKVSEAGAVVGLTAAGTVQLTAGGTIFQDRAIIAPSLAVRTTAGNVDLTGAANSVATFAASATAGFVALLEADAVQIGSVAAVGGLAALDGITATGGASIRTVAGSVTQAGTGVITAGAAGLAVSVGGAGSNITLDTATNATALIALSSPGTASYKTSSDLNVGQVVALGGNAQVTGATAATSLALTTTGANTVIAQSKAIDTAALTLATGAGGQITLLNGGNLIGSVQSSGTWGTGAQQISDNAGGLNVGPITSDGNVSLTSSDGGLVVVGAVNVGATKTLALTAKGDNPITATAAAITAGTLTLETGTAGSATITTAAHDIGTIQTAGTGVGTGGITFTQSRVGGTTVGPITSAGAVSITNSGGDVTVSGAITTTNNKNVTLTSIIGNVSVNAQINVSGGQVALIASEEITQANANAGITADGLRAQSTNKSVTLAPTNTGAADVNNVNTFAANASSGSVSFRNGDAFNVGTVDTTAGIVAGTSVTLQVNAAGDKITQSAGAAGAIITPTLNLTTNGGDVTIDSPNNDIAALGTVNLGAGEFIFSTGRASGFNVGAVTADGGITITNTAGDLTTTSAITSDGKISLRSTTGLLNLGSTVTSFNKGIELRSNGALNTGGSLVKAANVTNGNVTLISDTSTVTIGPGGVEVGNTLTIQIGAGLTLNVAGAITGAKSVALHADSIEISANIGATDTITLAPVTAGTAVTVGGAPGAGFVIDSTELTFLTTASTLTIGKQSTGTTTAGAITIATSTVTNGTFNLFSTASVTQTGALVVANGLGALNVSAGGTIAIAASTVQIGSLNASTTSGNISVLRNSGIAQTFTVNGATTAGGDINIRSFDGDLTVAGAISSSGGNILFGANDGGASVVAVNSTINAGTGAAVLFGRGITQSGAGTITAKNLAGYIVNGGGSIALGTADNVVTGDVTLAANNGGVAFRNTTGFNLTSRANITVAGVFHTVVGGDTASLRAGAGDISLAVGGNVTQSATANDGIVGTTLNIVRIGPGNPSVTLDNANNTITNLGIVTLPGGSLTLIDLDGLTISGDATVSGYSLQSTGSIFQNVGTSITADTVTAKSTGLFTSVSLNQSTNQIGAVSGSANGNFFVTSAKTLTANAVSAAFTVGLTTVGGTSDLSVNGIVGGTLSTILSSGGNISQTATGGVVSPQLQASATSGSVDLTAGAANNNVSTIAGQSNGNFAYTDNNSASLTIGTVSTVGIVSTAGSITVKAAGTGAKLTTTSAVTASAAGKGITLESVGDLNVNSTMTANAGNGMVSLTSTTGSVIEQTSGIIAAAELLARAATNVDIAQTSNAVGATGFAAQATTGFVVFINTGAITLDAVAGVNGVSAGGAVVLGTTSGDISQTANGIITAGAGLGLVTNNGSITLNKANLITGNVAVVNTPNGDVTIRNTGDLNVGTVGPITTAGIAVPALNGIQSSTAAGKFVLLISDNGAITQSAGAANRIIGNELRLETNGKAATLTNTSNSIAAVGNTDLKAGKLTVFDGVGDLTLSNPVTADGGVILTTQTTFNLPGSITVANGDISLTSLTGSIALGSTLSAANGQIQLEAGGVGTITQTGGTITANSLIVRAPGSVTLVEANNDVGTIAGSSATGTFTYVDKTAVAIGSLIDSTAVTVNGITTANQDIIVVAGKGGAVGGIAVDQAVNAGSAVVRLQTSKGDITQGAAGVITGGSALANAFNGSVNLAAAANAVVFWAGQAGGSFRLQTASQLGVTTIAADGGALTTGSTGIVAGSDVALQTTGAMGFFSTIDAGPGGTIRLRTTTAAGTIGQLATGNLVGDALLIDAGGAVTLNSSANNDVNTLAGRTASGAFRFQDKNGFTIGTVGADGAGLGPVLPIGPVAGVTTAGGDITLAAAGGQLTLSEAVNAGVGGGTIRLYTGAGDLTQGGNGSLTGGSLLAVSAGGMVNLTGAPNTVTGIAGSAATSFLFQNQIGYAVSNVAFAGDGIVPAATGITANAGGGGTAFVVDLAVTSGTLAINGPVSATNGMIVYRRTPGGAPGAINVGGAAGNPGNDVSTARLVVIDHTGASATALYGATPGVAAGGLFSVPTPATGFSPLTTPGSLTGGTSTIGELSALNSTVYIFASTATIQSTGGTGATFGLLGVYGQNNTANLTTSVRTVDPNQVRAITDPFTDPLTSGPLAAFHVRHDGLATATEQFNTCPIGTINCVVFTTPIAAPSVSTDDVVISVGGAPLDDSSLILVNQANEDLIIDNDEERDKKKKGGTPQ